MSILGSLQKLAEKPTNTQELKKLVQAADTVMGAAKFLQDAELEKSATKIVKTFANVGDVRKKIDEYGIAYEQFGRVVANRGACPKGYHLVNGKCIRNDSQSI